MSTGRPAFKETQVFTWELEPADERRSEFASSAFMEIPQDRPVRPKNTVSATVVMVWIVVALCASGVLVFGGLRLLRAVFS